MKNRGAIGRDSMRDREETRGGSPRRGKSRRAGEPPPAGPRTFPQLRGRACQPRLLLAMRLASRITSPVTITVTSATNNLLLGQIGDGRACALSSCLHTARAAAVNRAAEARLVDVEPTKDNKTVKRIVLPFFEQHHTHRCRRHTGRGPVCARSLRS